MSRRTTGGLPPQRRACPLRPTPLRHCRCSLWLAHGFEPVLVKQWSGHSKASMLHDVYGHVIVEPDGDEWSTF
jgi:integrase